MMTTPFVRSFLLLGLSSFVIGGIAAPAARAQSILESNLGAKEDASDSRYGVPGRRIGGGTRSETVFANTLGALTAITTPAPLSITTASHPTLLFYVPEMASNNSAEFVLRDSNDALVYEKTFEVSKEAGFVTVGIADMPDMPALTPDENYQWYFSIVPNVSDRSNDTTVYGSIRRVAPSDWFAQQSVPTGFATQLAIAEPLMEARLLYQQANLWHDAAIVLNELRQAEPDNEAIAAEWNQLLASAGLTDVLSPAVSTVQAVLN